MSDAKKPLLIEGWARIYVEKPREKGGIFTFTHTIWIYESKWQAEDKELDKEATCLGFFPICIEVDQEKQKVTFKQPDLHKVVECEPIAGLESDADTKQELSS